MTDRRVNIRQKEMGERIDEMFDEACTWQKRLSEVPKNFSGIPTKEFLATYRLKRKVGVYASERYFQDYRTAQVFEQSNPKGFKVSDTHYKRWLQKESYTPFDT